MYQSGVPGLAVVFYITNGWSGQYTTVPNSQTLSPLSGSSGHYVGAQLVVSGPVSSGTITQWPTMTVTYTGSCISTVTAVLKLTGTTSVTSNTCSVTTPTLDFSLPKGFAKDLATAGATTGDTRLSLGLNCSAGINVAITITDATNPANRSTSLSLATDSSASGLGIQILNGTTPVAFGPDSAVAGTMNQWTIGSSGSGGTMSIPLTARYVRTTGTLVPGSVKARATFTMSYQ